MKLYSQTYFIDTGEKSIREYIKMEKKYGSDSLPNDGVIELPLFPFDRIQKIKFVRNNIRFSPRPIISYIFSLPDSIVRKIKIELDSSQFFPQNVLNVVRPKEPSSRFLEFKKQYDLIKDELVNLFGTPSDSEELSKKDFGYGRYWWETENWLTDSARADMLMRFSDGDVEGICRIYAMIYFVPKN